MDRRKERERGGRKVKLWVIVVNAIVQSGAGGGQVKGRKPRCSTFTRNSTRTQGWGRGGGGSCCCEFQVARLIITVYVTKEIHDLLPL